MKKVLFTAVLTAGMVAGGAAIADEDWYPSKWGAEDTIGAANYITPERVKAASDLVTEGKTYALGIETNRMTPAYPPRSFSIYIVQPGQQQGQLIGPDGSYNDDIVNTWLGIGSQIDGLGHVGINNKYYNGNEAKDFADISGLKKLGVEGIPPIVARGVLLDMTKHFDTDVVPEGTAFNQAEIDAAAEAAGVEIREGDVVLFHTGWLSLIESDPQRFASVEPGLGKQGAEYLTGKGVVAIGADTWALEVIPFEEGVKPFEIHQIMLSKTGTYILENMQTAELAADGVSEFMFVLGAARMSGAVQMIVNPVAIR